MGPSYHDAVLVSEVARLMAPVGPGVIVDATFGGGGHTAAILEAVRGCRVLAVDRDPAAAPHAARFGSSVRFVAGNFRTLHGSFGGSVGRRLFTMNYLSLPGD